MGVPTSGNSGSLKAEVLNVKMDINDDDEDVIIAIVSISNEAPVPMGGLDVSVITNAGEKYPSKEGVSSLGPGVEREWTFEFVLGSGEWTFVLKGSSDEIKMGPYAYDFEYSATQGRKLASTMGSSLFSGAFNDNLGDFGNVIEREMIDPTKVVMTSYAAENSMGGDTLIKADLNKLSTGLTATSSEGALEAPILNSNPIREAPPPQPSVMEDPLLSYSAPSSSVNETLSLPSSPVEVPLPPPGPPNPPAISPSPPSTTPPTPPSTPPPTPPANPPSAPAGPPAGPPTGPPTGPPAGPPAGPPTGPPSSPKPSLNMPEKPNI